MTCGCVGQVVASRNPKFPVGALVNGHFGWCDYAVATDEFEDWAAFDDAVNRRRPVRPPSRRADDADRRPIDPRPTHLPTYS